MKFFIQSLLFVSVVFGNTNTNVCNHRDAKIYKQLGVTFPKLFRSFGGLTVSKSEYTDRIVREVNFRNLVLRVMLMLTFVAGIIVFGPVKRLVWTVTSAW